MQSFFSMAGGGGQTRCFTGDVQMANTTNNRFILFSLICQKCIQEGAHPFLLHFMAFHVIFIVLCFPISKRNALAGNRTRASRVAGENSTTEPPVPC